MIATRSKLEIYLHLVWSAKGCQNRLADDIERPVYRCVSQEAERQGCRILAIGGTPNHIHVVVCLGGTASPSRLAKQMKGVSSALLNDLPEFFDNRFAWQDGYACFSISRPHVSTVIAYVRNQRQHHAKADLWPEWEETSELSPAIPPGR